MDLDSLTAEALARCEALGQISDDPSCLTRTFLSPATRQAHELVTALMREARLDVRCDAISNLIGRRTGSGDKVFIVGSHVDTVPDAGKYDGVLGVMLGIAAVKALAGRSISHSLDVIAFSEEEGVRFRTPYLGSRAITGQFDPALLQLADSDGTTLSDAIRNFGLDPTGVPAASYPAGAVTGYLEVHTEQGPVLESLDQPLGIVEAIVGQSRFRIDFVGKAGHAGTQPMELRKDALTAAAEFVLAVEQSARSTAGLRATVGRLNVTPGAANVVPGSAEISLDVRHADDNARDAAVVSLLNRAREIATARGIVFSVEPVSDQPAVAMDSNLTARLAAACPAAPRVVSGAGHDAAIMARLCPSAMLFIRSPGGISHHPDESVRPNDVRVALEAMVQFLLKELQ